MNAFMGSSSHGPAAPGWKQYLKVSDLRSPALKFAFVEEHANSIDDGYFLTNPNRTNAWLDLPGNFHPKVTVFGFADGHAEVYKWIDGSTLQPVIPHGLKPSITLGPAEGKTDLTWVLERATAVK